MPKWRKLHTKTVDSLDLNDMPDDFTRLLWILLPLKLDRCGRGLDNPAWIRSKIFPLRQDVSVEMVSEAMDWYQTRGMIERYENGDRRYFWIPTWHRYQGNTAREAGSDFPPPESYADPYNDNAELTTNSRPTHDQLTQRSCSDVDVDADVEEDADTDVDVEAPNAFDLYQQAGGILNALQAERVGSLIDEFELHRQGLPPPAVGADQTGDQWVGAAIQEAASATSRISVNYVKAILDRWKTEGFKAPFRKGGRGGNGRDHGGNRAGQSRRYTRADIPTRHDLEEELATLSPEQRAYVLGEAAEPDG